MMKDNKVKQVIDIGFDDGQTDIDQSRVPFTRSVVDVQKNLDPTVLWKSYAHVDMWNVFSYSGYSCERAQADLTPVAGLGS